MSQVPDAKKHSDNTKIMVKPIALVLALNLEFGHYITQHIINIALGLPKLPDIFAIGVLHQGLNGAMNVYSAHE